MSSLMDESGERYILIVDDEPALRETIVAVLEEAGYLTGEAGSAFEALAHLERRGLPSLILTDLAMPAGNGWVLVQEVRRRNPKAHIPIVVCSAVFDPEPAANFLHTAGHLRKPFSLDTLLEVVEYHCGTPPELHDSHPILPPLPPVESAAAQTVA
jgi:CheY-like chemotaxis protein